MKIKKNLRWKVDTPALFKETLNNNQSTWILKIPYLTLSNLLGQVVQRCSHLNDPILNQLMCDLNLYDLPSPTSEERRLIIEEVDRLADIEWNKLKVNATKKNNQMQQSLITFFSRKGINKSGICKEAGVTHQYLNRILKGTQPVTDTFIAKLLPVMKAYGYAE